MLRKYTFDTRINCFIGKNGVGKSNILDAIYHLCFGKGYFIHLQFKTSNLRKIFLCSMEFLKKKNARSVLSVALNAEVKKPSNEMGRFTNVFQNISGLPLVIISPADRDLIVEGRPPEENLSMA